MITKKEQSRLSELYRKLLSNIIKDGQKKIVLVDPVGKYNVIEIAVFAGGCSDRSKNIIIPGSKLMALEYINEEERWSSRSFCDPKFYLDVKSAIDNKRYVEENNNKLTCRWVKK